MYTIDADTQYGNIGKKSNFVSGNIGKKSNFVSGNIGKKSIFVSWRHIVRGIFILKKKSNFMYIVVRMHDK